MKAELGDLAAQFLRRRCAICGACAAVVCPGTDAMVIEIVGIAHSPTREVRPAIPDINLCLGHAAERWPWRSHKKPRQGHHHAD